MGGAFAYRLQGHAAAYFVCEDREVLNESGARTGKTHCELLKADDCARRYPGSRQLFARETRKSLTETVLPDFENKVLGRGHPALGRRKRNNRDTYEYPNGSTIVLHGLDDPENVLSGEFDRVYVFQAEQIAQDSWDALLSRLSGSATPYCQATADANPGPPSHWLMRRLKEVLCLRCGEVVPIELESCRKCGGSSFGRMRHFPFRHTDNPRWFDWDTQTWRPEGEAYVVGTLGRLRGVRKKRLAEHLWVAEEGLVLDEYDPDVHRIAGKLEQVPSGGWLLDVSSPGWEIASKDPWKDSRVHLDWFGAGADFGWRPRPGVLSVWGYDRFGRRFRVAEVYRLGQQLDWWGMVASQLYGEFKFRYIAVDPSSPALRDAFNRRIALDHKMPAIAIAADNTIRREDPDLAGIDLMRWGIRDHNGVIRTYFLKDATRHGRDPELLEESRPTCTEEEIPEWHFARKKSTDQLTDKPDETCYDDGLDAYRYESGEGWGIRCAATIGRPKYPVGSAGEIHRHEEKMEKARAWREARGG